MKDKSKSAHEIHTFGRAFLDYSYYILVHVQPVFTLSIRCPEVEKKIFKEIWPPRVGGQGFRKYTIMCVLALQVLHTKCGQDWPNSFWEKLLMWYGNLAIFTRMKRLQNLITTKVLKISKSITFVQKIFEIRQKR